MASKSSTSRDRKISTETPLSVSAPLSASIGWGGGGGGGGGRPRAPPPPISPRPRSTNRSSLIKETNDLERPSPSNPASSAGPISISSPPPIFPRNASTQLSSNNNKLYSSKLPPPPIPSKPTPFTSLTTPPTLSSSLTNAAMASDGSSSAAAPCCRRTPSPKHTGSLSKNTSSSSVTSTSSSCSSVSYNDPSTSLSTYEAERFTLHPEELSILELHDRHKDDFPLIVRVSKGFYGMDERSSVSEGDIFHIHFVKQEKVVHVRLKDIGDELKIPVNSNLQFGLLYNPFDKLKQAMNGFTITTVGKVLEMPFLPHVLRTSRKVQGLFDENELMIVMEKKEKYGKNYLKVLTPSGQYKHLNESCEGHFVTKPHSVRLFLSDICQQLGNRFPLDAVLYSNADTEDELPLHFKSSSLVTLVKESTSRTLVASSEHNNTNTAGSSHEGQSDLIDVPLDLDIAVQILKPKHCEETEQLYDDTRDLLKNFNPNKISLLSGETNGSSSSSSGESSSFHSSTTERRKLLGIELVRPPAILEEREEEERPPSLSPLPPPPRSPMTPTPLEMRRPIIADVATTGTSLDPSRSSVLSLSPTNASGSTVAAETTGAVPCAPTSVATSVANSATANNGVSGGGSSGNDEAYVVMFPDDAKSRKGFVKGRTVEEGASMSSQLHAKQTSSGGIGIGGSSSPNVKPKRRVSEDLVVQSMKHEIASLKQQLESKRASSLDEPAGGSTTFLPRAGFTSKTSIGGADSEEENRKYLSRLSCGQVLDLLERMGLQRYKESFSGEQVTGELLVEACDESVLEGELGVSSRLHRTRILKLIEGKHSARDILEQPDNH